MAQPTGGTANWWHSGVGRRWHEPTLIQFDNDGVIDVWAGADYQVHSFNPSTGNFELKYDGGPSGTNDFGGFISHHTWGPKFLDVNGDGLTDILMLSDDGASLSLWLATGNGYQQGWTYNLNQPQLYKTVNDFVSGTAALPAPAPLDPAAINDIRQLVIDAQCFNNLQIIDYDLDGRADLALPCMGVWHVLVSRDGSFQPSKSVLVDTDVPVTSPSDAFVSNFFGNGTAAVMRGDSSGTLHVFGRGELESESISDVAVDRSPVSRAMRDVGFPCILTPRRSRYEAQALHRRTDHFDHQAA